MSFLFSPPKPPPLPPLPPVPAAPSKSDAEVTAEREKEERRLRLLRGRESTILTAGLGVLGDPDTVTKGKQTLGASA